MKFCRCQFCKELIENHHIKLHEKSCPLNPTNLKAICAYLKRGIVDTRLLKRASFYDWAIANRILTSITITNRLKLSNWQQALYQLLIYGYLNGFIEFVYVEILLHTISHGSMWLDAEDYRHFYNSARDSDMRSSGVSEHLYFNHYLLLMHILHRCNCDIRLTHGSLDENKEIVDVKDATHFLLSFAPELFEKRCQMNEVGCDALKFAQQHEPH